MLCLDITHTRRNDALGIDLRPIESCGDMVVKSDGQVLAKVSPDSLRAMLSKGHAINEPTMHLVHKPYSNHINMLNAGGARVFRCGVDILGNGEVWLVPEEDKSDRLLIFGMRYWGTYIVFNPETDGDSEVFAAVKDKKQKEYSFLAALSPRGELRLVGKRVVQIAGTEKTFFHPLRKAEYEEKTYVAQRCFITENGVVTIHDFEEEVSI